MARQQLFVAFVVILIVAEISFVNSYAWQDSTSQQHYQGQTFQQQYRPPSRYGQTSRYGQASNIEFVQGTIDQLNHIDVNWVCTNPKTGDQMIIGAENGNGNTANYNPHPQQNLPVGNVNYLNVQQPGYNPQGQLPGYKPQGQLPGYNPQGKLPGYNPSQTQQPQIPLQTQYQRNPFLTQQPQKPLQTQNSHNPFLTQQPKNPSETQQPKNPSETQHPQNPSETQHPQNPSETQHPQNPSETQHPQNPLQPQQPQNSGFTTDSSVIEQNQVPTSTVKMPIEDVRKKFDNFDWTQYVTMNPVTTSDSSNIVEFDGKGIIEARSNF